MMALGIAGSIFPMAPSRARAQSPESAPEREGAAAAEPTAPTPEPPVLHADVDLAERYASAAFEAYRAREYGRAVSLYEQALAAAPSADILYNIARVYDAGLRDQRSAIEYYERYRAHPNATPELFETATRRLAELRAAEPPQTPPPEESGGIAREFPADPPARPAPAPAAPPVEEGLDPLEITAITFGAAGLVGIGLGIGFGLSARAEEDTWGRDCNGNQCTSQRAVDAAESAARSAGVATVGFAVGGGLLAIGTVLWLVDTDPDAGRERPNGAGNLRFAPALGTSSVGGTFSGSF